MIDMHADRYGDDMLRAIVGRCDGGSDFAVAVVLKAEGSTPRKTGVRMIVDAGGAIRGTIGGGLVEAETQRRAVEAIKQRRAAVFDFHLEGGDMADSSPVCGGTMRVLIDPDARASRPAYAAATAIRKRRQRGALLTTVRGAQDVRVAVECLAEAEIPTGLGFPGADAVRSVLEREQPELYVSEPTPRAERIEVLVEPLTARPVLVIAGGGHVGQAVAAQASMVGFDIVVIDDRPEFTRPELFPEDASTRCGPIGEELARFPLAADCYVVIVTRGHGHDAEALAACLHQPAAYIGMIGSRRKVALMRKEFIDSGRATAADFDRVCAPIGLDIGSETVPEIAASIVAQLIAVRRTGGAPRIPSR